MTPTLSSRNPVEDATRGLLLRYAGMLPRLPASALPAPGFAAASGAAAGDPGYLKTWADRLYTAVAGSAGGPIPEMSRTHLLWLVSEALAGTDRLPADKICRWLGFCEAALAVGADGHPGNAAACLGPLCAEDNSRIPPRGLPALSRSLGFVQGCLCAWRVLTVQGERDHTRPAFHRAYREEGIPVPPTVGRAVADPVPSDGAMPARAAYNGTEAAVRGEK